MTRINSAIPVKQLTDEHLVAEHYEIKRICNNFHLRNVSQKFNDIPNEFVLGTGHVLFFIDKPVFTLRRYMQIHFECLLRNFDVTNYSKNWDIYKNTPFEFNDHIPTLKEKELLIERIETRINKTNKTNSWHYYGEPISKQKAIEILKT